MSLGSHAQISELLQGMIYIFWLAQYGSELPDDFFSEGDAAPSQRREKTLKLGIEDSYLILPSL